MALRIDSALSLVLVISMLALTGCKSRDSRERVAGAGSAPGRPAAKEVPKAGVEPAATKEQAAQAQALTDEWLRAQNGGDFSAYEALYAQRFTGIKRVGARTARFDREGWMQDRKAMFARAFSVRMDDLHVNALGTSAIALFQQTWSSASFRDVGRKQLILVREGSVWRIAGEEMKESHTVAVGQKSSVPNPREFAFVAHAPEPLLILSADVDLNAVAGELRYVTDELVRRPVVTSALPQEMQELLGSKFALYADGASVCEAIVGAFEVLISLHPHFGTLSAWNGSHGPVVPVQERALELWRHSEHGGRFLVARLDTPSACERASWARSAALPKPALWTSRAPTKDERLAILKAARTTALHRQLQQDFERAFGKQVPWDDSGSAPRLALFEGGVGQTFASLTVSSGADDSCSSPFDADVFYLLQKRAAGWVIVSAPPEAHAASAWPRFLEPLRAEQAFDLEGDGRPEFVGWRDFIRESGGTYRSVLNRSPAYFDCPC